MPIKPSKYEVESSVFGITRGAFWMLVAFVFMFVIGTGYWWAKPYWLGLERKAYTASHQYNEAGRTSIMNDVAAIGRIDVQITQARNTATVTALRQQRLVIVERIRLTAGKMTDDAVPENARRYLSN